MWSMAVHGLRVFYLFTCMVFMVEINLVKQKY